MILKRIGPMSIAKVAGSLYAAMGLLIGLFFALFSLVGSGIAAASTQEAGPLFGMLFGVGAIFILPLFYGAVGFVSALIGAALYNFIASKVGGVELELE